MPSGNEPFAIQVADYWAGRGDAKVWIDANGHVASNLVGGLPPRYRGALRKLDIRERLDPVQKAKQDQTRKPKLRVVR